MKKVLLMTLLAVIAMAGTAQADVTFAPFVGFGGDTANDQNDVPIADGTYALLIDLDNDGWNGVGYGEQSDFSSPAKQNDGSWLWDLDDFLLDLGKIEDGTATPSVKLFENPQQGQQGFPQEYTPGVDQWWILWFSTPLFEQVGNDLVQRDGPGKAVWYGAELLGNVPAANSGSLLTPFPPSNDGRALLQTTTVVPEPISASLALIGGAAMFLRRRFTGATV